MHTPTDNPGTQVELKETPYKGWYLSGFMMLLVVLIIIPALMVFAMSNIEEHTAWAAPLSVLLVALFIFCCVGYVVQEPNETRVMIFFGKYMGTFSKVGYYWVNPLMSKRKISLRVRNMDIDPIKVNDKQGNPVLIGMVLVWKIRDTYRVVFDIDVPGNAALGSAANMNALESFVRIQSDAALREVTGRFAYDNNDPTSNELTLRSGGEEINELLEHKINERLSIAGMEVVEARLNYLAYAPEIAAVMLRRQQADAIISAREKIVEGAVSMVQMALNQIDERKVADFTPAQKASLVSNLLVVLSSDEPATPIINTDARGSFD